MRTRYNFYEARVPADFCTAQPKAWFLFAKREVLVDCVSSVETLHVVSTRIGLVCMMMSDGHWWCTPGPVTGVMVMPCPSSRSICVLIPLHHSGFSLQWIHPSLWHDLKTMPCLQCLPPYHRKWTRHAGLCLLRYLIVNYREILAVESFSLYEVTNHSFNLLLCVRTLNIQHIYVTRYCMVSNISLT